ncbi:hypothetical protein [Natribacillus halophilus]|uniref:YkvI family membrane protein n=1 Tax=Natribacillus halophilus TaxID=549003 RepID=UPI00318324A4
MAGSGSLFEQQFGIPPAVGYFLLVALVILTTILRTERIVTIISYISPYMIALALIVVVYSLFTSGMNFEELDNVAHDQLSAAPHWLLSALLYVSFNFSVGFAMMAVIGSTEKNKQAARRGAIVGGIILGVMVLVLNLGIYANIDQLQDAEMPTLALATEISPLVGILMAIALLGMIFNTATAMFYSFTARFVQAETPKFRGAVVIVGIVAFALGFIGFVDLVNTVYPMLGYVGFVLIGAVLVSLLRSRNKNH